MPHFPLNSVLLLPAAIFLTFIVIVVTSHGSSYGSIETEAAASDANGKEPILELPQPLQAYRKQQRAQRTLDKLDDFTLDVDDTSAHEKSAQHEQTDLPPSLGRHQKSQRPTLMDVALQASAREGLNAMTELYDKIIPSMYMNGQLLEDNHPAALLSKFSAPAEENPLRREMAAFATVTATKAFRKNYKYFNDLARQAHSPKISLRRTALEALCPPRDPPTCMPASERYRTHDGTCNNKRRSRWGAAQMPFNRFLPPEYGDGVDSIRDSVEGGTLSSSRFVSLLVHGAKDGEASLTLMTAQWGQLLDHDMTSTAQPRSINGSVPSCCGGKDFHPSCFPIKVPLDDPWLAPLKVRCLEFLRSAPAQRRDCILSWREQTNQATSYIDASPIYSNSAKLSDNARVFRKGLLVFGRGNPADDVCQRGALATQCIRAGDGRSGEQPGLLALHHVWVGEHNRIAMELSEMNLHWSDEKVYQETRRIVGAMFQHITYREFLPIILGREVCKLFDLELLNSGFYQGYDTKVNPTVANSFAAAAFRFGHSLVQNSYMRCDRNHNLISNNVSLHEEFQRGDIGSAGSLHRLLRGMAFQRALKRDEFITPELTNHLFQTPGFPFGLDLAAINIQRGRDHGVPPYTAWRIPCGLTPINTWDDFVNVVGPESAQRIAHAYRSVHDIDLFVGGISERPVVGGLVGPTFACIIAQQFSNSRKGDRFWYENGGFESSFTPAQLHSLRRVSLAQVLCRSVGGGTFQPHIFIPAGFPGNDRVPCGVDALTPIDLEPWLELDPFNELPARPSFGSQQPERIFNILPTELDADPFAEIEVVKENKAGFSNRIRPPKNTSLALSHVPHIDFVQNGSTGFQRPSDNSKVHDKLDIRQKRPGAGRPTAGTPKPFSGVHNKLDNKGSLNLKGANRNRLQTTTRRTVIINNVPIELRSAVAEAGKSNKTSTEATIAKKRKTGNNQTTKNKKKATTTKTEKPEPRVDDLNEEATTVDPITDLPIETTEMTTTELNDKRQTTESTNVETMQHFDVSSALTETVTMTETTTTENSTKATDEDRTTKPPNHTEETTHVTNIDTTLLSTSPKTDDTFNLSDIDPLVHSTAKEHKRVQRRSNWFDNNRDDRDIESKLPGESLIKNLTLGPLRRINLRNGVNFTKSNAPKTTPRSAELRQYQTQSVLYTRPQKVILDGPNSDQYEIEINIRQTNKKQSSTRPIAPIANYPGYTTVYKPFGYENYSPHYVDYHTSTLQPPNNYYQPQVSALVPAIAQRRTRPPTVIYLNEHDDRTTTRQPGLLQNFITFATSGFSNNRKPVTPQTTHKEKPIYEPSLPSSNLNSANSPHSSGYLTRPQSTASFSQVGGVVAASGAVHASSNAVSSGSFGSITGVASANGVDSTFSFNIRPRPEVSQSSASGSYGLLPVRKPPYAANVSPEYLSLPVATTPVSNTYNELPIPHRESVVSPFSSSHRRPISQPYYSRTQNSPLETKVVAHESVSAAPTQHVIDSNDYDYLSRTLQANITNDNSIEDDTTDDYDYGDDEENEAPGKKFDRDGYLRPEHMAETLLKAKENPTTNETTLNSTYLNDNYVLPVLNLTQPLVTDRHTTPLQKKDASANGTVTSTTTDYPDAEGKHLNNDILAEDYEDSTEPFLLTKTASLTAMTAIKLKKHTPPPTTDVAFAPITILTKPERPDNWVIFDTPKERPLLPTPPEIKVDTLPTDEIPMPIKGLPNAWLAKYIKKEPRLDVSLEY